MKRLDSEEREQGFAEHHNKTEPELDGHFREDSQQKLAGAAMLEHGWNKHIVALLQILAQKHSTGVDIGGSPSTLLNIQVVKAEPAVHLHLEANRDFHSVKIRACLLEGLPSVVLFIPS